MAPELQGVVIGSLIGFLSSLIGIVLNHRLTLRREKLKIKLETEKSLRKKLTEGVSPNIYNRGMEKLYKLIDDGKLPRSYAIDPDYIDNLLSDLLEEEKVDDL